RSLTVREGVMFDVIVTPLLTRGLLHRDGLRLFSAEQKSECESDGGRYQYRLAGFLPGVFLCVFDEFAWVFVLQFLDLFARLRKFFACKIARFIRRVLKFVSVFLCLHLYIS